MRNQKQQKKRTMKAAATTTTTTPTTTSSSIIKCLRDRSHSRGANSTIQNSCGVKDHNGSARLISQKLRVKPAKQTRPSLNFDSNRNMHGACNCSIKIQELNQRIGYLEKRCSDHLTEKKDLEMKIQQLTKKLNELNETKSTSSAGLMQTTKKSFRKKPLPGTFGSVQPSKFVAWMNLSNLWKHRPSIETLKQQNIYNDEPCFDTEIEMVYKHEVYNTVPKIIVDCCDLIEEKYRKSPHPIEGLYRSCGDYNQIQTLRFRIDANDYDSLRQVDDVHTLTGLLKLFLREIKSPLVKTTEIKSFIGQPNQWLLTAQTKKIQILERLITSLPEINRDTMKYLFSHFHRLTKVPLQSISADTLSLSITPSIFHTVQGSCQMQDIHILLKESEVLADCVMNMIEYHSKIFESMAEQRQRQRRIRTQSFRRTLSHPSLLFQSLF